MRALSYFSSILQGLVTVQCLSFPSQCLVCLVYFLILLEFLFDLFIFFIMRKMTLLNYHFNNLFQLLTHSAVLHESLLSSFLKMPYWNPQSSYPNLTQFHSKPATQLPTYLLYNFQFPLLYSTPPLVLVFIFILLDYITAHFFQNEHRESVTYCRLCPGVG